MSVPLQREIEKISSRTFEKGARTLAIETLENTERCLKVTAEIAKNNEARGEKTLVAYKETSKIDSSTEKHGITRASFSDARSLQALLSDHMESYDRVLVHLPKKPIDQDPDHVQAVALCDAATLIYQPSKTEEIKVRKHVESLARNDLKLAGLIIAMPPRTGIFAQLLDEAKNALRSTAKKLGFTPVKDINGRA